VLSETLSKRLNAQINHECASIALYMQMSAWCAHKGYDGCAHFFRLQAHEERGHMEKLFEYMLETGGLPTFGTLAAPPLSWKNLRDLFQATLEHEQTVSREISALVETALGEKDYSTFSFLQWYVAEQHEEEHRLTTILDRIDMITTEGHGVFTIDREISRLTHAKSG